MKKAYYAAAAAIAFSLSASAVTIQPTKAQIEHKIASTTPLARIALSQPVKSPARVAGDPTVDLEADQSEFWYYGDLFGNGTGVYFLFLSSMDMEHSMPLDEGQMLRILLIGDVAEDSQAPTLPAGTFSAFTGSDEEVPGNGTFYPADSDYMDVFFNPDDPESGDLYGYMFELNGGSLTVAKDAGLYDIAGTLQGQLTDDEGEVIFESPINVFFEGDVPYYDHTAYTPLGSDVELAPVELSGRCEPGGGWSMAFYNVELDNDGFIIGAGQLLNVEIYTEAADVMTDTMLEGTYTAMDLMNSTDQSEWPGHFMIGVWYEFWGMYMPIGTNLAIYDDYANITNVGLCNDGTITFTNKGNEVFEAVFDLITEKGEHITGRWEGELADYVQGCEVGTSAIESIDAETAPAEYFNLQGQRVAEPESGLVIRRQGTKVEKVMI